MSAARNAAYATGSDDPGGRFAAWALVRLRLSAAAPAPAFMEDALQAALSESGCDVAGFDRIGADGRILCSRCVMRTATGVRTCGPWAPSDTVGLDSAPLEEVRTERFRGRVAQVVRVIACDPDAKRTLVSRFARFRRQHAFTAEEIAALKWLTIHFGHAIAVNERHALMQWGLQRRSTSVALVGRWGGIVDALPEFSNELEAEFPGHRPVGLPDPLYKAVSKEREGRWAGRRTLVEWTAVDDRKLVEVRPRPAILRLTPKEQQVARLLVEGLTHDQIARVRNISVNTVRSQLYAAHRKLDAKNQAQFVTMILGEEGAGRFV